MRFLFASLSDRFLSAQQQYWRHSWWFECFSIAAMTGVIPSNCAIFTWLSSWQAKLPRARAHFCWHPAFSTKRFMAAIVTWMPPPWPMRCWTPELLQARSPRASAPCCDTLSREGCDFIPATIPSTPPSPAILFWCSWLPQASLPSVWHASSTIPEWMWLFLSACTIWRWPLARTIFILFSALRHRFLSAQQQYWMHSGCPGCSARALRTSWIPFCCAIFTWLAEWHARFPSARVHFCMQPPLFTCACVARTISSIPPSSDTRSWIAEFDHARFPSAEHPISCTSMLSRCESMPAMTASIPPAAATAFCSSALPHTRLRMTCMPSTCTRASWTQARRAATICSGSPFSLLRARIASEFSTAPWEAEEAPASWADMEAGRAATGGSGADRCVGFKSLCSSFRSFFTWIAVSWRSSPLRSSSLKSSRSLPLTPLAMNRSILSWGMKSFASSWHTSSGCMSSTAMAFSAVTPRSPVGPGRRSFSRRERSSRMRTE
mmetsp:Transcript_12497/g.29954  ORF Transcript_12497/g.29954 Transcript_12497/m.29954 type:complete len:492 (-) Transcript_12497:641-2116(-)